MNFITLLWQFELLLKLQDTHQPVSMIPSM